MICTKCGAAIPEGSQFCPRCGTPVVAAPPAATPVTTSAPPAAPLARTHVALWVAIAVAALGLLAWAVLSGLPFGTREPQMTRRVEAPPPTITEGGGATGTVSQIDEPITNTTPPNTTPMNTTATTPPPVTATAAPMPPPVTVTTAPPPRRAPVPAPAPPPISTPQPPVVRDVPSPQPAEEISEAEATGVLSRYLNSNNTYDVSSSCLGVRNLGYRNVGYTLEVVDRCAGGTLGKWRVDSKTRELFRQQPDGRFLRP